ncbi:prostacyclin receptor [Platysternon megacephalum]|uniref:Prostacyclin receptor n=1 Tax=Platysternon megacephalum TaxID=55544 RepID=A0A4D9DQW0_9SAUR|nr:prostacyclin receptor [Platysternon megacephalum]
MVFGPPRLCARNVNWSVALIGAQLSLSRSRKCVKNPLLLSRGGIFQAPVRMLRSALGLVPCFISAGWDLAPCCSWATSGFPPDDRRAQDVDFKPVHTCLEPEPRTSGCARESDPPNAPAFLGVGCMMLPPMVSDLLLRCGVTQLNRMPHPFPKGEPAGAWLVRETGRGLRLNPSQLAEVRPPRWEAGAGVEARAQPMHT